MKIIQNFEKHFNEKLDVLDGEVLGQIFKGDNLAHTLTIYVPNIDVEKDVGYLAIRLPLEEYKTQINIPETLNASFEKTNEVDSKGNKLYKTTFTFSNNISRYAGQVKINLIIMEDTGEKKTIEQFNSELGDEESVTYNNVRVKSSVTMFLNVRNSSNFNDLDFNYDTEDEVATLESTLTEILRYIALVTGQDSFKQIVHAFESIDSLPDNLEAYENSVIMIKDSKKFYKVVNKQLVDLIVGNLSAKKLTSNDTPSQGSDLRAGDFIFGVLPNEQNSFISNNLGSSVIEVKNNSPTIQPVSTTMQMPKVKVNKTNGPIISTPMMSISGTKMNIMTTTTQDEEKGVTKTSMTLLKK